jgi:hypothetical protein
MLNIYILKNDVYNKFLTFVDDVAVAPFDALRVGDTLGVNSFPSVMLGSSLRLVEK